MTTNIFNDHNTSITSNLDYATTAGGITHVDVDDPYLRLRPYDNYANQITIENTNYNYVRMINSELEQLKSILRRLAKDIGESCIGEDPNILDDLHELEKLI